MSQRNVKLILKILSDLEPLRARRTKKFAFKTGLLMQKKTQFTHELIFRKFALTRNYTYTGCLMFKVTNFSDMHS
jgi:hypothetical protein